MTRHKLKEIREGKGLSQQKIADSIGITRAAYNMIENNKRNPGFRVAKEIKKILEYENDDLFS